MSSASVAAELVDDKPTRDRHQPRTRRGASGETRQQADGAQETLLRYIIRACRIGEESSATHHVVRT
jgi:hypothetical protein